MAIGYLAYCACARDMSTRPMQVEVTLYLDQNRYRKPRCRIGLLFDTLNWWNLLLHLPHWKHGQTKAFKLQYYNI